MESGECFRYRRKCPLSLVIFHLQLEQKTPESRTQNMTHRSVSSPLYTLMRPITTVYWWVGGLVRWTGGAIYFDNVIFRQDLRAQRAPVTG
jgi:hypothetical protein